MKRYSLFFLITLLSVTVATAAEETGSSSSLFEKGNAALAAGDYEAAADAYRQELETSGPNAAVLFNLGNALYRQENYGAAILAYERALVLDPHAEDIRANLRLARDAATAFEDAETPFWKAPLYWLGLNEWLFASLASLGLLGILSLVRGIANPKAESPRMAVSLRTLAALGIGLLLVGAIALATRRDEMNRGIVVTPDAKVRLSPFATADVVATLPAGRTIHIDKGHEGFFRIENGWISESDASRIYPRP